MPDTRNALEILQKALHWMMHYSDRLLQDGLRTSSTKYAELKVDIAALKAMLANMPQEEHAFLIPVDKHILSDLIYNALYHTIDSGTLANRDNIELDEVTSAEFLLQIIKGIAV